jgi:hypothetical protein
VFVSYGGAAARRRGGAGARWLARLSVALSPEEQKDGLAPNQMMIQPVLSAATSSSAHPPRRSGEPSAHQVRLPWRRARVHSGAVDADYLLSTRGGRGEPEEESPDESAEWSLPTSQPNGVSRLAGRRRRAPGFEASNRMVEMMNRMAQ